MAEAFGVTASAIAIIELSAKVVKTCAQYREDVANARQDIQRLEKEVGSLGAVVRTMSDLSTNTAQRMVFFRKIQPILNESEMHLAALQSKLDPGERGEAMSKFGLRALKWNFSSQDMEKTLGELARLTQAISLAMQVDQTTYLLNLEQDIGIARTTFSSATTGASRSFRSDLNSFLLNGDNDYDHKQVDRDRALEDETAATTDEEEIVHKSPCNGCRRKEIKCDRKQPCTHCQINSYECNYYKPSKRRSNPPSEYVEALEDQLQRSEALLKKVMPNFDLADPTLDPAMALMFSQLRSGSEKVPSGNPKYLDLYYVESLEDQLRRTKTLLTNFIDVPDPTSTPMTRPLDHLISSSDTDSRVQFADPAQGDLHSEPGCSVNISESSSTDTSRYSRSYIHDMASTAPTEPVVGASNEVEVLESFVNLVHQSDAVVKALDQLVRLKQSARSAAYIESRVRTALKSFVAALKLETPPEHETVPSIFLGRSRQLSSLIIQAAIFRRDEGNESTDGDDSSVSDDEAVPEEEYIHDEEEYRESARENFNTSIDMEVFEYIVLESKAFTGFLTSLYDIAFPDFTTRLTRTIRRLEVGMPKTQESQMQELFCELAYAQPTQIVGTAYDPGFSDNIKNAFESLTGTWNWWPLSAPLKPLGPREMRISWTCRCGRARNENVPKKVAKALISLANSTPPADSIPSRPSSTASLGKQPSSIPPRAGTVQESSSSANSVPVQDIPRLPLLSPDSIIATYPDQQTRTIFFMTEKGAIHPKSMGLGQTRISTQGKCNDRFFKEVRHGYWKYRGWIRTMFSIYQFGFCEFYRFTEYAVDRYAKGPAQEIPKLKEHRNEYYYREAITPPQVGPEEFRDRFWNCSPECDCNDNNTVDRIPQKISETAVAGDKVFYGIIAREEKQIYMAAIYLATIGVSIIPSLWFFVNWLSPENVTDEALLSNRKGNLSNAIVPLSLSLTILSCVLGVLIAI